MYPLTEYVIVLVVILFCTNITWSIEIPRIDVLKEKPSFNDGTKVLQCLTKGANIKVHWTFNDTRIEHGGQNGHYELKNDNSALKIKDVTPSDTGAYRCIASNKYGMIFDEVRLKIIGIGHFKDGYTDSDMSITRNVTFGKPYEIKCPPHTHLPGQMYKWAVPDLDLWSTGNPIDRIFLSEKHGSLFFSYITADDVRLVDRKGGIACLIYTGYSNLVASTQIKLRGDGKESTVDIPPEIVVPLADEAFAVAGEKKTMMCGATGRPHPKFTWYKDGKLLSTDDEFDSTDDDIYFEGKGIILKFKRVRIRHDGTYKCVASNSNGTDATEGKLTVHSKVKLLTELEPENYVPVKSPIILECSADGFPKPNYIWYHNSSVISSSSRRIINNGSLRIPRSKFSDGGMYLCTAENMLNTKVSPAYVVIQDVPPVITKGLSNSTYYYLLGESYSLKCEATGGPEPTISWYKDGKLIKNNKHLTVKPDETLVFNSVTKEQDGVYKCVAKNRKAEVSSSGNIKVFVRTLITRHPAKVDYAAGSSAYLFCDAVVDDTIADTWQWLKDGKLIDYNDHVYLKDSKRVDKVIKSHTLKIENLNASDGGIYTCKVFTRDEAFYSEDAANGSITVKMAPLPVGNLQIAGAFDKGNKEVVLSWTKPNKFVGPADEYIIEYAPANTSLWVQYDPPKKYGPTNVKLDKDKLPASADLVFRVKAVTTYKGKEMVGEPSEPTEAGSLVTPSRAPNVKPMNVRLELDKDGNISAVAWDKLDKVNQPGPGFKVMVSYREVGSNKSFTNLTNDGDASSVEGPVVSDIGEDKEYEVVVKSKNDAGAGPERKVILKVPGKKVNQKVQDVKLTSITTNGATVTWKEVPGATGYRVFYTKKKDTRKRRSATKTYKDVVGNKITITDLKPGSQYEITVAATNLKGAGPRSDPVTVDTKKGAPDVPDGVAIDTFADKIRLTWPTPDNPDIKNYTVTWYPNNDPSKKKTMTVSGDDQQAIISDDLDPDTYYTVKLTANSDEGSGEPWIMEGVVVGEPDRPGKPAPPNAVALNESVIKVTFNLPDKNIGGLPDAFKLCYRQGKKPICVSSTYPDEPSIDFDNLDYWVVYEFFSIPENKNGRGMESDTVSRKPRDPPTTTTTTTTPMTTPPATTANDTAPLPLIIQPSTGNDEKAFYEEIWFIILLIILIILIIIAIILCIICNRRGGRYPVGEKEKNYGGWDKDPLKDYDDDNALENGAGVPLVPPNQSPDRDSIKKTPFQDDVDDEDSLADYTEGYGDMGQYGTDKKETNGQTVC